MRTQFSRSVDHLWFKMSVRRQITILVALPALVVVISLISLGRLWRSPEDPLPISARQLQINRWHTVTLALGATAGISLLSVLASVYWVKRLHQELYNRDSRFVRANILQQAIQSCLVDAMIMLDSEGRIEQVNEATHRLFGYDPEAIVGQSLTHLLSGTPGEFSLQSDVIAVRKPGFWRSEYAVGKPQFGALFPVEVWVQQIPSLDRQIVIIRDVTQQEQLQTELLTKISDLAYANAELEQVRTELRDLRLACHDLKSPLQAIAHLSTWIEADLNERVKGETQHQMTLLRQRVYRMEGLVGTILERDHSQES